MSEAKNQAAEPVYEVKSEASTTEKSNDIDSNVQKIVGVFWLYCWSSQVDCIVYWDIRAPRICVRLKK